MEELPFPNGSTVKMAIGNIESAPTTGSFDIGYEGNAATASATVTATSLQTALNGLDSITSAGGVTVSLINGNTYRISFNSNGARSLLFTNSTNLEPSATAVVQRVRAGDANTKEIQSVKLKCIPVAYTQTFIDTPSVNMTVATIDATTNRLSFSALPKDGSFIISDGSNFTPAISVTASAQEVLSALVSGRIADNNNKFTVTKIGMYAWDLTQTTGTVKSLTTNIAGVISFASKTGIIDLNTIEVEDILSGAQSVTTTMELEVSDGTSRQTIYQGSVQIINDLIDASSYNPSSLSSPASQSDVDAIRLELNALEAVTIPAHIVSPLNNQVLAFNSSNGKWENKDTLTTFAIMDGGNF